MGVLCLSGTTRVFFSKKRDMLAVSAGDGLHWEWIDVPGAAGAWAHATTRDWPARMDEVPGLLELIMRMRL